MSTEKPIRMQKLTKLLFFVVFLSSNVKPLSAQTNILYECLLSQPSFDSFTAASVTGAQTWTYSSLYGAVCSGYVGAGQNFENEDWLISPAMNLTQTDNVKLTFTHSRGSASVLNLGVAEGRFKVFVTADNTGDPTSTQWVGL